MPTKRRAQSRPKSTPPEIKEMGDRLRTARKRAGVSIVQLAAESGVEQPAISKFETGKKGLLLARLVRVLQGASRLGIDVNIVLGGIAVGGLDEDVGEELMALALRLKRKHGAPS